MYQNLAVSLARADELLGEMQAEYNQSLRNKVVSDKAVQITHDLCEKLRSVLDRVARRYWDMHVAAHLSEDDRAAASVYFPVANSQQAFDSTLGRWRWQAVRDQHQAVYSFLEALQPFSSEKNRLLSVLNSLAVQSKHIDLIPQKRIEERRVTVSARSGSVSWGSGVTFGSGVSIMGAPFDPRTQRIVPTPGVEERIEVWVSFIIVGHDVNALGFCQQACQETRHVVTAMSDKFGL